MIDEIVPETQPRERLQLLKSPLVNAEPATSKSVKQPSFEHEQTATDQSLPILERHEEPTLLEVFFDLFFAANYAVFTKNQSVYTGQQFASHVGYFSMLWMTWLVICFFDVRFITDSVFERAAKGAHLGVMVGFAVVAPNFNPSNQDARTMRTMSLILMVSRLVLACEYAAIAWHIRKFKKSGLGLKIQIGICIAAAIIYLAITFRFTNGNSRVFVAWYAVSAAGVILTLVLSNHCAVMGLTKTHLMKRLTLLTVIILGDGIVVMAEKVVAIVKSPGAWNPLTIGTVTAATSMVYFLFLIYFDWIREFYLPAWRQQIWTLLHFPFHLALVLWQTCFAQFIMWTKILDVEKNMRSDDFWNDTEQIAAADTSTVQEKFVTMINGWWKDYPLKWDMTAHSVQNALYRIGNITDDFWPEYADYMNTQDESVVSDPSVLATYEQAAAVVAAGLLDCLFASYEIDLIGEAKEKKTLNENPEAWYDGNLEIDYAMKTLARKNLVFTFGYIAAGIVLAFMTILSAITRKTRWKTWPIIRTTINLLLSIGIGLVALLDYDVEKRDSYLASPWLLPTICITQFVMLMLTHVRSDGPPAVLVRTTTFFSGRQNTPDSVEAQCSSTPKFDPVYTHHH
ncbi:hypothetical protein HJFPF1_06274 [Paramyrothecium foliicola]|nr:hypothetical protein HJFPF1_06274 [Paramyrothecium foliicola]